MSNFAALMALSATQTRQTEAAVKDALAERQRKEAEKRRLQEERDKREREMEAKLRLKKLEEEKRERERQERQQKERQAKERELQRKEEEQRNALRYGPKRASNGYPVSSAASRRKPSSDDDDGGTALTREEKRKRRMEVEMRYGANSHRRAPHASGYRRHGKMLPGGAVDITTTTTGPSSDPSSSSQSVKARIAAEPSMLIKLNVNKRDTRTIDEILQDREKARAEKVLQGEDARHFNDWFSDKKKAAAATPSSTASRANTPAALPTSQASARAISGSASPAAVSPAPPKFPSFSKSSTTPASSSRAQLSRASGVTTPKAAVSVARSLMTEKKPAATGSRLTVTATTKVGTATPPNKPVTKKRPRSPSRSLSPAPSLKKRAMAPPQNNSLSAEIWKMFGKDRNQYVARDIFSDDEEDMEAGASDLEREEMYSTRLAKKEDEVAMEQERRHEEEKRRRRKEREMREKRA
ncbi:hypothetical protein OBBRIDRAFT_788320 [Obba rivulosa]|uniref:SPT2 chromatin protein n=1 Tax=Obba rivulosa TaxID=1052685 RepID=A0A8E2DTK8_9APHY|nr:hypothetical protein OBBRIDRAFT_788320 [Obba rivulosa]